MCESRGIHLLTQIVCDEKTPKKVTVIIKTVFTHGGGDFVGHTNILSFWFRLIFPLDGRENGFGFSSIVIHFFLYDGGMLTENR